MTLSISPLTFPFSRTPALKTYSKRVNHHTEEPPSKKRRVEEPVPAIPSPRVKKTKGSTIRSYFKPLQSSSIPSVTRNPHHVSNDLEHTSSPRYQLSSDPLEHPSSSVTSPCQFTSDPFEPITRTRTHHRGSGYLEHTSFRISQLTSDPVEPTSTPPSSPPPRAEPTIEHAQKSQKKPKRRLKTRPVLAPIVNISAQGASAQGSNYGAASSDYLNVVTSSAIGLLDPASREGLDENIARSRSRAGSNLNVVCLGGQNLHQTQLDMGVPAIKICKECGMQYNTTLDGDRRNHSKFHNSFVEAKQPGVPYHVDLIRNYFDNDCHIIREIDFRVSDTHKDRAYIALKLASHDLGGVIPTPDELWSLIINPQNKDDQNQVPRYKLYFYLVNLQPVGLLLAERVTRGGDYYFGGVLPSDREVFMCIERIWVREDMRRKGIASQLVNQAREHFVPGLALSPMEYAFSQPTKMGREFANAYVKL
jgi:GNAT superfamily N-acetyltransferase